MLQFNLDLSAPIIPGKSLAHVELGSNISLYLSDLVCGTDYTVQTTPLDWEPEPITFYKLFDGAVEVSTSLNGTVLAVYCSEPYNGLMMQKYRPGQKFGDLRVLSDKLVMVSGFLMMDGMMGGGFLIPDGFEYYDTLDQFPTDFSLKTMFVQSKDHLDL